MFIYYDQTPTLLHTPELYVHYVLVHQLDIVASDLSLF